jgi:hypothetical protein
VTSGLKYRKRKLNKKTGLKVGNRFTKYISSTWRQAGLCIRILIVVVVLFVLLQAVEVISLYVNVNSGGLGTISGAIYCWSGFGLMASFFPLIILLPACFIISLIKIYEPISLLLTVIAAVIAVASFNGRFYLRDDILKCKPEPDSMRCVANNTARGKGLKKFGLKLNQLKKDKDLVFTEQFLELNLADYVFPLTKGKFVLNANLLNKKPSQIADNIVVIFESNVPYDNGNIGGPNDISTWWHYGRGSLMVFGDGRVKFVKTEKFNNLQWKP